jgi:hypothetical protein
MVTRKDESARKRKLGFALMKHIEINSHNNVDPELETNGRISSMENKVLI